MNVPENKDNRDNIENKTTEKRELGFFLLDLESLEAA